MLTLPVPAEPQPFSNFIRELSTGDRVANRFACTRFALIVPLTHSRSPSRRPAVAEVIGQNGRPLILSRSRRVLQDATKSIQLRPLRQMTAMKMKVIEQEQLIRRV